MKKIILIMMLGISLMGYGKEIDEWQDFGSDSNGINYQVKFNEHGAILKNNETLELIYLGKDGDTFLKKYGKGNWNLNSNSQENMQDLFISFKNKKISFFKMNFQYFKSYSNDTYSGKTIVYEEGFLKQGVKEGVWLIHSTYDKYENIILNQSIYKHGNLEKEELNGLYGEFIGAINYRNNKIIDGIINLGNLNFKNERYYLNGVTYTGDYFIIEDFATCCGGQISKIGTIKNGQLDGKQVLVKKIDDYNSFMIDKNSSFITLYKKLSSANMIKQIVNYKDGVEEN